MSKLRNLKNKDMPLPDDYGLIISDFGKTGSRKVRVIGNSVAYVSK
ncbi:MAG: hypothetical protein QXV17_11775 [Candidatus Micrarchaeaceae archaeon]